MHPNQKIEELKGKGNKSQKNLSSQSGSKNNAKKTKQKYKQKDKQKSVKKIKKNCEGSIDIEEEDIVEKRNEYYNKQKRETKHKQTARANYSEYINLGLSQKLHEQKSGMTDSRSKLNLDKVKGVITFEGKFIKKSPSLGKGKSPANWDLSSENYTELISRQEGKTKVKSKSKNKSRNKNKKMHSSKVKGKNQRPSANMTAKKDSPYVYDDSLSEEDTTKNTPVRSISYSRCQKVDMSLVKQEVNASKNNIMRINFLRKVHFEKRSQCIALLSRICGQMQFRREIFSLSILLFDSFLNDQVLISKHKICALACLLISLKLQEAQISNLFYVQLSAVNLVQDERQEEKKVWMKKNDGKERQGRSLGKSGYRREKQKQNKKQKQKSTEKNSEELYEKFRILRGILKQQMEEGMVNKGELLQIQMMILLKQSYMVWKRTYNYWVDMLTLLWDQYILEDRMDSYGGMDCLLFRCYGKTRNFSYLIQIIEASLYTTQFHSFSNVTLVTSAMYLLIRINMEGDEEGFDYYRMNLQKSSNILFVDKAGVNLVFGEFLSRIQLEMGEILPCCQFLSTYLNQSILVDFPYEQVQADKLDHALTMHFVNSKLYPF